MTMSIDKISVIGRLLIFLKTILMIPLAVIAHILGAILVLILIPTTIHDIFYKDYLEKKEKNASV